jgi:hypothetical protein
LICSESGHRSLPPARPLWARLERRDSVDGRPLLLTYDRFSCETLRLRLKFAQVQIDVATAVPTLTIWGNRALRTPDGSCTFNIFAQEIDA